MTKERMSLTNQWPPEDGDGKIQTLNQQKVANQELMDYLSQQYLGISKLPFVIGQCVDAKNLGLRLTQCPKPKP